MNISHDGKTVSFKTVSEELFLAEKSGAKPNAVRIIDHYEYKQLKKKQPTKIKIRHGQGLFLRTLTHVYVSEMILGKYLAIFSWTNEEHHHAAHSAPEQGPGDHTMSIDPAGVCLRNGETAIVTEEFVVAGAPPLQVQSINISTSLLKKVDKYRGDHSYDKFIRILLANFYVPADKPTRDMNLALIGISKGMMDTLTDIAHGRSMDKIIRDLYQRSLNSHAEEVGPLYD